MKLYYHPQSGQSHRAVLFLSLIGVRCELVEVDLRKEEHHRPEYLALNPFRQIPVLDDAGASVQRWLSVAAGEVARGPCAARLVTVWNENLGSSRPSVGGSKSPHPGGLR
jgi:glutathione S-transferase